MLGELAPACTGGSRRWWGPPGRQPRLRIIAGLERDFEGEVTLPAHGTLGMVFQEPRLLPWRTVEQNVRLAAPRATDPNIDALFRTLGLAAHRDHYPGELSLGLARRVALARAFAVEPDLLLLDEPSWPRRDAPCGAAAGGARGPRPVTTLLVTHDVDEAIACRPAAAPPAPAPSAGARPRTAWTGRLAAMRDECGEPIRRI